ncbi:hypothetical protein FC093_20090 [Ilyomonas limi]|uniref:DUF2207 domain-containing protein n=1 Tax=Ilyomonas limi TaxID=2575867 RepID=A0A4V5UTK5_9BACT|nr:hypothetical protein [Ilyomonas limi]TKK65413.1 hypothetical protein FC093_20090 [Ilyomonas limi]
MGIQRLYQLAFFIRIADSTLFSKTTDECCKNSFFQVLICVGCTSYSSALWYRGNYATFNTHYFMRSLDHSMNTMSATFYSAPSKSGGSFGSGGSSGGGFGEGGGSSW